MSIQIICDRCRQNCSSHFQLTGWWALNKAYERPAQVNTSLESDYCTDCVNSLIPTINSELSRTAAYKQYLETHPQDHPLKALRKTVPQVIGITCDCCRQACDGKFARLNSSQLTDEGHLLYADICPACLEGIGLSGSEATSLSQQATRNKIGSPR